MITTIPRLEDLIKKGVKGKKILLRLDLNVPMEMGEVRDDTRILRAMATITALRAAGAKLALASHYGRPKGVVNPDFSLAPLAPHLSKYIGETVKMADESLHQSRLLDDHNIVLLENLRFHKEEEANDADHAKALSHGYDFFVSDAFSCAHRAHASVVGITDYLESYAGVNLIRELEALDLAMGNPQKPVAAIIGGAKISTKLALLDNMTKNIDVMIIGGGMANTFLAAQGKAIGKSLCETDMLETAKAIMAQAQAQNCKIILPCDVAISKIFKASDVRKEIDLKDIEEDDLILDIGQKSIEEVNQNLSACKTLIWNGPMGVFELSPFDHGTNAIAQHVAGLTENSGMIAVAGGGDTVAALNHALQDRGGADKGMSYVSTAGGAFLEWLEGKELPGVKALQIN